jgi:hypothetical protein
MMEHSHIQAESSIFTDRMLRYSEMAQQNYTSISTIVGEDQASYLYSDDGAQDERVRDTRRKIERALFDFKVGADEQYSFADILDDPLLHKADTGDSLLESALSSVLATYTGQQRLELASEISGAGYGIIVVRPEVLHMQDHVVDFLSKNNIAMVNRISTSINSHQYAGLYSHAFLDDPKQAHVRRRAFGYIDRELQVLVVRHKDPAFHNTAFMDYITDNLKGVAGRFTPNTLRGDLIYRELAPTEYEDDKIIQYALDPLRLYRNQDIHNQYGDNINTYLANLPGVHIPDSSEIDKDLCVMAANQTITDFLFGKSA